MNWHFPNSPVLRNKEILLKNFSQIFVKTALCGLVGSERVFKMGWDTSQQAKSVRQAIARTGRFTEKRPPPLPPLLRRNSRPSPVTRPALVRPREGGGYEIIAGHRRQRASELAGFANMPCIVRNMTDDEAILPCSFAYYIFVLLIFSCFCGQPGGSLAWPLFIGNFSPR